MEQLVIKKGGKLIETKWVYDEEKQEGSYKDFDITDQAIRKLFEVTILANDVTLKDIFLLLNSELDIFDSVMGNWCKEIVKEGLFSTPKEYIKNDDEIEYLELYYTPHYTKYDEKYEFFGMVRPDFHGIGFEREKDSPEYLCGKKGERTPYSLAFSKAYDLINIPIKLRNKMDIYEENDDSDKLLLSLNNPQYTLGMILYGIIWELSFHGGPESRTETFNKMKAIVDDIKLDN